MNQGGGIKGGNECSNDNPMLSRDLARDIYVHKHGYTRPTEPKRNEIPMYNGSKYLL